MIAATGPRLDALIDAWNKAAADWNLTALAALYTPDALLFGGRAGHSVGGAAIHGYFESYAGVILSASLELFDQQILNTGETSLIAQGFGDFAFTLAGERRTRSRMRTTLLLDWRDGVTRIRLHHFSPPPEAPPLGG